MKAGIIGFGVLGRQIMQFLHESIPGEIEIIIFDDYYLKSGDISVFPFIDYLNDNFSDLDFYIGLGYKHLEKRSELIKKLRSGGKKVKTLIHKTCYISPSAKIGDGCILFPGVNIDQNVFIQDGCILHNGVIVSHDTTVGKSCYLAPGAILSGNVSIGNYCFLGTGSLVSNSVKIESNVQVGIGSVVSKNIESGLSVIGNPAITLPKKLNII